MCGWNNSIAYRGDDQNTEFDALQVTLSKAYSHGLNFVTNYQWASAFGDTSNLWTWSHTLPHLRDSNVRTQQLVVYGSYDLPFGKGKDFMQNADHALDLLVGGWQLADTMNLSNGLPFTASYNECSANVPNYPNPATSNGCAPNAAKIMHIGLTTPPNAGKGTFDRQYYTQQIPCADVNCKPGANGDITDPVDVAAGTGIFTNPGLDHYRKRRPQHVPRPEVLHRRLALTKAFTVWEQVAVKFRVDAFNVFNHINAGNPSGNVESTGTISGEASGCVGETCGPRQMEFSLRVQF